MLLLLTLKSQDLKKNIFECFLWSSYGAGTSEWDRNRNK
jgi:hypothetical protein